MENNSLNSNSSKNLGIISLVIGIVSIVIAFIPCVNIIGIVGGFNAVSFGIKGRRMSKLANDSSSLSMAGSILGILAIIISSIFLLPVLFVMASFIMWD